MEGLPPERIRTGVRVDAVHQKGVILESGETIDGGAVYPVEVNENRVETALHGPANTFLHVEEGAEHPDALAPFEVWFDPQHEVARIELQEQEVIYGYH